MLPPKAKYTAKWFNPSAGEKLQDGTVKNLTGGGKVVLVMPQPSDGRDWVVVIRR